MARARSVNVYAGGGGGVTWEWEAHVVRTCMRGERNVELRGVKFLLLFLEEMSRILKEDGACTQRIKLSWTYVTLVSEEGL